jgi:hypothetical protein
VRESRRPRKAEEKLTAHRADSGWNVRFHRCVSSNGGEIDGTHQEAGAMIRNTALPSRYRCLRGAAFAVLCLVVAALLIVFDDSWCGGLRALMVPCEGVPVVVIPLCLIGAVCGVVHTAYRAYRDFWMGDYLWDVKRAGHL